MACGYLLLFLVPLSLRLASVDKATRCNHDREVPGAAPVL
jgi:hypothetical protein